MDLWLQKIWYSRSVVGIVLMPLGWLYRGAVALRRTLYRLGWKKARHPGVPVVVVGNITAGGTGKTPLVLWLVEALRDLGYRPGIVSRGYGGARLATPMLVTGESDPRVVGDEPVLMARRGKVPVAVFPDRVAASTLLIEQGVNLIVADDGLQHYGLMRDVELAVIDGERGLGNRRCLPAGPLREPPARLAEVDAVIVNGAEHATDQLAMRLDLGEAVALGGDCRRPLSSFAGKTVHAIAGIGNPSRFFRQLERAGLTIAAHPFPDHASFDAAALAFADDAEVLMTEKDAVKCPQMTSGRYWYIPVAATFSDEDSRRLLDLVTRRVGAPANPLATER